jgi:ABC-type branched-subunit amino acid transport system substrate-binding protein
MMNRRNFVHSVGSGALVLGAGGLGISARAAESAISAKHITIGGSMPTTGPLANAGTDHTVSILAAMAEINRAGGVNGRELRFLAKDDGYNAARTVANVKEMIDQDSAFAFMSFLGTPNTAGAMALTEKAGISVLGPVTGASSLRKAEYRHTFFIRPTYTIEVQRMVAQLTQSGISAIAVVYLDNAFGKEVLADTQVALAQTELKAPVAAFALAVDGKNADEVAQKIAESNAGAVFLGTTGTGSTDFVLALRKLGSGLPVLGLSVTFTDINRLGKHIVGLAAASVLPSTRSKKFAVVRRYWASLEAANMQKVTGLGLESYVATHLMAEAIRRAGRDITREKLRAALASVRSFEMGELNYGFPEAPPYVAGSIVKMGVFDADALLRT